MKPGDTFYKVRASITGLKFYKCHVLAIIEDHVMYKWYGKHKQWWHYEVKHIVGIKLDIQRAKELKESRGKPCQKEQ